MKTKSSWVIVGILAATAFPLTATAGNCLAGNSGCAADAGGGSQSSQPQSGTAKNQNDDEYRSSDKRPVIAPIGSSPEGQTYGRWAVEWLQWAYGVPGAVNPLTDTTGEFCAQRQVDNVWFLAGTPGSEPIERTCEIPAGKALFFPQINIGYGAWLNDPPETRTEAYIRAAGSCTVPAQISVQIDGFNISNPTRYFTGASGSQSPLFNIQLPPGKYLAESQLVF